LADFMQHGVITTLHRLTDRPIESLEAELEEFSRHRKLALVLPSLFSELGGEALPHIVDELAQVRYLDEIVIGLDAADAGQFAEASRFFSRLTQRTAILWHDGPRLRALDAELAELELAPSQAGKGRNVWYCFGYVLARDRASAVALHDCDILTYSRDLPARLFYPVANPNFGFSFAKGYYARVADGRLSGRVTRLFFTPLVRALKQILGPLDYLVYLDSFRYPLSGELAMRTDEISNLRIPSDWGLEVGTLSEVYRNLASRQICQVDIADTYDHKHQPLSPQDPEAGLSRMSVEIAKSIYRKLATEGVTLSNEFFRTIKATYFRIALDMLGQYDRDARLNGLVLDRHAEEQTIEAFTQSIMLAGEQFLANPMEVPFMPNWNRVFSAIPDFGDRLLAAVEADNAERSAARAVGEG
jgi:glucosyl-3-phosphoglycerate synthase